MVSLLSGGFLPGLLSSGSLVDRLPARLVVESHETQTIRRMRRWFLAKRIVLVNQIRGLLSARQS